jgi:hypothetical protein
MQASEFLSLLSYTFDFRASSFLLSDWLTLSRVTISKTHDHLVSSRYALCIMHVKELK